MAVRAKAEVLDGLTSVLGATEEEGVSPGGRAERKLVQGQHLTAGLLDPGSGGGGEAEGRDRELGDGQDAVVIGNGADDDDGLALVGFGGVLDDAGERDGRAVDPGHEQAAQHDFVEVGISAAWGILYQHRRSRKASAFRVSQTYGQGSDTASPEPADRRSRSWAPCGGSSAHDGGPGRYLRFQRVSIISWRA